MGTDALILRLLIESGEKDWFCVVGVAGDLDGIGVREQRPRREWMGWWVQVLDAPEAGGLPSGPRRGPAAARQGAQRPGARRDRCGFFFVIPCCVSLFCEFLTLRFTVKSRLR